LLERGAHAECVCPQPFHFTRTENPRLAVTPWNVTATLPAKRFPLAFFGTRHLQAPVRPRMPLYRRGTYRRPLQRT